MRLARYRWVRTDLTHSCVLCRQRHHGEAPEVHALVARQRHGRGMGQAVRGAAKCGAERHAGLCIGTGRGVVVTSFRCPLTSWLNCIENRVVVSVGISSQPRHAARNKPAHAPNVPNAPRPPTPGPTPHVTTMSSTDTPSGAGAGAGAGSDAATGTCGVGVAVAATRCSHGKRRNRVPRQPRRMRGRACVAPSRCT